MAVHPLETLVVHPGALGDVLQTVPALRALTALGHRLTFAGQPRLGELLQGLGVVPAWVSFDGFGFEALFVDGPPPAPLRSRLGQFRRAVSWFGSRDACYRRQLAALIPESIVAPPVPDPNSSCTVWEHLIGTLAPWQVTDSPDVCPLSVPESCRGAARARPISRGLSSSRIPARERDGSNRPCPSSYAPWSAWPPRASSRWWRTRARPIVPPRTRWPPPSTGR